MDLELFGQDTGISSRVHPPSIPPSPKYEVRAVWITTVGGLDWPTSFDRVEQQRSLREMVALVKAAKFNTIFFQVRGRADAMYRSHYEPWSRQLTGTWGEDPGWDPLKFILDEAHAYGIEVHAWFNTFLAKTEGRKLTTSPPHVTALYPEWVRQVGGEWWLDPGLPQVREYLMKIVLDIIRSYPIDGMHFDFIRYPGPYFPDEATFLRYGEGVTRHEWRRENINLFVRAVYDSIKVLKPLIKVGSTPVGIYTNIPEGTGLESFHSLFQDSRLWLQERKHDYLAPQVYWSLGNSPDDPDFEVIVKDWAQNSYAGRHIYIGIGAYKPQVFKQLPELIDISRRSNVQGNAFFRYEHISQWWRVGERYAYPAIIPPMPWKDFRQPEQPTNLSVQELGQGRFILQWRKPPRALDGDLPKRYVVYRSWSQPVDITDAANIAAITTDADTNFLDVISRPISSRYYYAVTALDKGNNESLPTNEETVVISEIAEMAKRLSFTTKLADHYTSQSDMTRFIPFEIREWVSVQLTILKENGTPVHTLVEEIRKPGKYVEAFDSSALIEGLYLVRLQAGSTLVTKPLRVIK